MLNTNAADTSTLELSSDTLSVLKVPNALTAGTGITAAGTFDGAAARTVSITPAQTAITSIINTSLRMGRAADSEYIDFGTDNEVRIAAGNVTFMKFIDDTQDKIIVGDGSSDIDFIVDDNSGNAAFTVQSSDGAVTIPGALTVGSIGGVTNYIGTNVIANTYKYNNSGSAGATAFTIGATGGVEFTQAISLANADFASTSSDGPVVSLKSNITNEDAVNFLGRINFSAPVSGSSGDDSRLLAASIVAQKSATFSSTSNQTDMIFELGVSEVASEKFRILSDGKIKIGNAYTLPAADGSANQILKTNGSGTVSFAAESTPAVTSYTNTGDNRVLTSVGGTTINGEANLTFDGTLLHISKETSTSASSTGTTLFKITNDVGADLNQQKTFVDFTLLDDNANETPQVRIGAEVGHNGDANTQEKEGSGAFVVYTNNADTTSGDAGASLAERMRVDYQGNVGIGTTSPTYELDVAGDIGVDHVIYHNDDTNTYHQFTNDRQRFFAGGELLLDLFEGTQDYVKLGDGGDVDINLNDDMFIQGSSSNVGIGTTSPGANLDVAGSGGTDGAAGSPTLRLSNTVDSTDWDTGDVVGTLEYYAQDPSGNAPYVTSFIKSVNGVDGSNGTLPSGSLTFGVASYNLSGGAVEKMRIDSTGNVGIGTISPSHEMVLRKDQAAETELSIVNLTSNSSAKTNLRFRNATSGSETGNGALIQLTNGNDFKILNQFGNNLILGTSNAEKMRINSSGNVGIGVTNPDSPLHIGNNVATSAGFDSFADYQILLYDTGTSTTSYGMGIRANTFMFNSDVDYEWRSDNSAKMFLDGANGRLGIGTTSPSYKLDVAGDIKTTAHLVLPYGEINDAGTDMNIVSTNALTLGTESGTALTLANASTVVAIANKMTLPASHSADKITMYSGGNEKIGTEANTLLFTADNYKFKDTAGHDNLFMNNSGNVGIGDNNPPNKLSVKGSSTDLLYLEGDGITSNSIIQSATGGSTRIRSAGGKIEFYTDGSANSSSASGADFAMVVNASQNVGIGTGSPSHKVHIDSNGSTNSVLRIDADDARGANRYALDVQDDDGNRRGVARFRHTTGSGNPPILIAEGYDHAYIFQSKNTSASDAEQFRIEHFDGNVRINSLRGSLAINEESGQNVGIGTSSPDTTLDVTAGGANGVVINQDSNDATNSSRMFFKNSSGTYSMYKVGDYLRVNSGATAGSSSGGTNLISIGSNVGIGATNPATKLCVRSTATFNTSIEYDASTRLRIGVAGSGVATFTTDNNAACAFTKDVVAFATSDKRLKDNIKPLDNAIDKVLKISGVEFDWNDTRDEDGKPLHSYEGHDVGVIAQEIEEVLPEVVTTRDNGYKAVKYEKIVPLLIEAIKEQQVQIDELKTKIGEQNG